MPLKVYILLNPSSFDSPVGAYLRKKDAKRQFHRNWPNSSFRPRDFVIPAPLCGAEATFDRIAEALGPKGGD